MTVGPRRLALVDGLPDSGRAAVRGGVWGNFVDQLHIFLPVTALAPALPTLAGPGPAGASVAWVVMATLVGRPLGAMVFGRISDRWGRTSTTMVAIAGTAACTLAIAMVPPAAVLGGWTIGLIIALRFVGGVFIAGEYSSAIPLAMEWSSPRRRGTASGLIMSMAPWAQGTIAFTTVGLLAGMGPDAYAAWGWRLPFVAGAGASLLMLRYYARRVADAPLPARRVPVTRGTAGGLADVVAGRFARRFWRVFALMSGLWFMTNMVAIVVAGRLRADVGLDPAHAALVMGVASVAQAVCMAVSGHVSTTTGRRRLLVGWAGAALLAGPLLWWWVVSSASFTVTAVGTAALQVVTVCAYGPVGAYLNECFPAPVRATAYGTAYSLSIVVPALYPWYLPTLEAWLGHRGAPMTLLALGAVLVAVGAGHGPRLGPDDIDAPLEDVARGDR